MRVLDVSDVRIYSNTKADIIDAMDLIGEEVYLSDHENFSQNIQAKLTGVVCIADDDCPFRCKGGTLTSCRYKYIILAKDAKFVEVETLSHLRESTETTGRKLLGMRAYKYFYIGTGASFWIRSKGYPETARLVTATEMSVDPKGNMVSIGLGTSVFTPEELLENYEWSDKDNDWGSFYRQ